MNLHFALQDFPLATATLQRIFVGCPDDLALGVVSQGAHAIDITDCRRILRVRELDSEVGSEVMALEPGRPQYLVNRPVDALVPLKYAEGRTDVLDTVGPPDGQETPVIPLVKTMAVIGNKR